MANWKQLGEEKRQATLATKRAKRDAQNLRARMADYLYGLSAPAGTPGHTFGQFAHSTKQQQQTNPSSQTL